MPNKVYIRNRLKKVDEDLAKRLEEEAKHNMFWGFQKDRNEDPKKEKKKKEK